jgi:3-keto-5-aminohexanoate cleavage enzyme
MKPLIICAAVTGGIPAKSTTPHHPVTPKDVAEAAVASWRAGAAMIHFHARLEDGSTSTEPAHYREIIDRIRSTGCDALLNASAGDNGGRATHEQRLAIADVGAEVVSLDAGSFNIGNRLYNNAPPYLRDMAKRMKQLGVKPEVEIFDVGHLHGVSTLISEGLLDAPYMMQFTLNLPGGLPADMLLLPLLISRLPAGSEWAFSTQTKDHQMYLTFEMHAFAAGGHVRTGMEDYVYLRPGELAKTNAQMVEQWVDTARIWGRPVASPADARRLLGIAPVREAARAAGD